MYEQIIMRGGCSPSLDFEPRLETIVEIRHRTARRSGSSIERIPMPFVRFSMPSLRGDGVKKR